MCSYKPRSPNGQPSAPDLTELAEQRERRESSLELCALASSLSLHPLHPGQHPSCPVPPAFHVAWYHRATCPCPQPSACTPSSPTPAILFPKTATKTPAPTQKMLFYILTTLWTRTRRRTYLLGLRYPISPTTTSINNANGQRSKRKYRHSALSHHWADELYVPISRVSVPWHNTHHLVLSFQRDPHKPVFFF